MADNVQAIFEGKAAEKFLKQLQDRVKKTKNADRKLLGLLTAVTFKDVIKHFQDEEGSEGPWDAWSDIYAQHMAKIGKGGNKILQDTGRLRLGFVPALSQKSGEFKWINPIKYARAHDQGTNILPKRDFMWMSPDAVEEAAQVCLNFILEE